MVVMRRERALFVVEFAFQDAQAGVGQVAGVPPAEQLLALGVDDGPASAQGGLVFRGARRTRVLARFQPVEQLPVTSGPVIEAGSQ